MSSGAARPRFCRLARREGKQANKLARVLVSFGVVRDRSARPGPALLGAQLQARLEKELGANKSCGRPCARPRASRRQSLPDKVFALIQSSARRRFPLRPPRSPAKPLKLEPHACSPEGREIERHQQLAGSPAAVINHTRQWRMQITGQQSARRVPSAGRRRYHLGRCRLARLRPRSIRPARQVGGAAEQISHWRRRRRGEANGRLRERASELQTGRSAQWLRKKTRASLEVARRASSNLASARSASVRQGGRPASRLAWPGGRKMSPVGGGVRNHESRGWLARGCNNKRPDASTRARKSVGPCPPPPSDGNGGPGRGCGRWHWRWWRPMGEFARSAARLMRSWRQISPASSLFGYKCGNSFAVPPPPPPTWPSVRLPPTRHRARDK